MYICICQKVTDHAIIDAIHSGADNRVALTNALGVGTGCGKCMDMVDDLVTEYAPNRENAGLARAAPALFIPQSA